jgi:hypothetical protein
MKQFRAGLILAVAMVIVGSGMSCSTGAPAETKKVTYKCLISSCDATVVCNEGDPVPMHHDKPMIR